ncbi:MAG TPA: creatininase family protein [Chloroflexota bacterium]|jgi:creatinine amidohydrolase/Fe(II)-dependent formamide hydrolase-like protein
MTAQLHHPFPAARYLPYLTSPDIAALPKDRAVVVLSVASVEQHGPHLPVITDSLVGQTVLARALERLDPAAQVWVVPPLCYGKSNEHRPFAGTLTLSAQTLAAVVRDIAASLARAGFRRLVLLNSHGGNPPVLDYIARDVHEETGMMLFSIMISRMGITEDVKNAEEFAWGIHAGEGETSWVLAIAPELVHMERTADLGEYPRMPNGVQHLAIRGPVAFSWLTAELNPAGVLGDPRGATAEQGEAYLRPTVEKLAGVLEEIASFEMPKVEAPVAVR